MNLSGALFSVDKVDLRYQVEMTTRKVQSRLTSSLAEELVMNTYCGT
jgi:hypothetical protein